MRVISLLASIITLVHRVGVRHLRAHRVRTLITVLGVAVGVAMFTGVRGMARGIEDGFAGMVRRVAGRADLVVGGVGLLVPPGAVDTVAAVDGVAHAAGLLEVPVAAPVDVKWRGSSSRCRMARGF